MLTGTFHCCGGQRERAEPANGLLFTRESRKRTRGQKVTCLDELGSSSSSVPSNCLALDRRMPCEPKSAFNGCKATETGTSNVWFEHRSSPSNHAPRDQPGQASAPSQAGKSWLGLRTGPSRRRNMTSSDQHPSIADTVAPCSFCRVPEQRKA
jgi:hypothetical protein